VQRACTDSQGGSALLALSDRYLVRARRRALRLHLYFQVVGPTAISAYFLPVAHQQGSHASGAREVQHVVHSVNGPASVQVDSVNAAASRRKVARARDA
jgi:hypothetical protein